MRQISVTCTASYILILLSRVTPSGQYQINLSNRNQINSKNVIYNPKFIAAPFIINKIWNQLWCLQSEDWIKTVWYIYTREYYSAIKKNATLSFAIKWIQVGTITLGEICQSYKHILTLSPMIINTQST